MRKENVRRNSCGSAGAVLLNLVEGIRVHIFAVLPCAVPGGE